MISDMVFALLKRSSQREKSKVSLRNRFLLWFYILSMGLNRNNKAHRSSIAEEMSDYFSNFPVRND